MEHLTETYHLVWLLSANVYSKFNLAMHELTSGNYVISDQHKELSVSRQKRDVADTQKLHYFIMSRIPFYDSPSLGSISTGATADVSVNVHHDKDIGKKILIDMAVKSVWTAFILEEKHVVTFYSKSTVKT